MNYVILIGIALFFIAMSVRDGTGFIFRDGEMNARIVTDDYVVRVSGEGNVDLAPDGSGVTTLSRGGSLDVLMTRDGEDRRVVYASENGAIERQFFLRGDEQPWGPEADRFVTEVMPIVLRETALSANERVAWLIDNRGQNGLLDEIELIDSDFAQRIYSIEYAKVAEIAPADFARLMRLAKDNLSSDFEARLLLHHVAAELPNTQEAATAYLDVTATIDSDFEMRLALSPLVTRAELADDLVARGIELAGRQIDSDFELRLVLTTAASRIGASDALARAYTSAAMSINSDFEHRLALHALADGAALSPEGWRLLLESAREIGSDFECATLLQSVAPRLPRDDAVIAAYRATLTAIESDFERQRATAALRAAGLQ
jgi:hypothetical protein